MSTTSVSRRLAEDPRGAVLEVLRREGSPLRAAGVKAALMALGASRVEADRAWDRAQRVVRYDPQVVFERGTYLFKDFTVHDGGDPLRAAQARQAQIDAVTRLAELAAEVEELCANGARPAALVERVRLRVAREGLSPIGTAGATVPFDRSRHKPLGGGVREGQVVAVVRPGYTWAAPDETVLIAKALVEE